MVVIGQLGAGLDVPDRFDKYALVFQDGLAIGIARVVDETGLVAAHTGIDLGLAVDDKELDMDVIPFSIFVPPIRLPGGDPLAGVLDDARPLRDWAHGEDAAAVDPRTADAE